MESERGVENEGRRDVERVVERMVERGAGKEGMWREWGCGERGGGVGRR